MGLIETSIALAGCVLVLVVAIVLDRRPYRPGKLNYVPLMIIVLRYLGARSTPAGAFPVTAFAKQRQLPEYSPSRERRRLRSLLSEINS